MSAGLGAAEAFGPGSSLGGESVLAHPRLARIAGLSIPILLIATLALWPVHPDRAYESPRLLFALNLVFGSLASLLIAYLVGRAFFARGLPGLLLFGCGVVLWGSSGLAGVLAGTFSAGSLDTNRLAVVHNTCVWLAALCHLAGVVLARRLTAELRARLLWLGIVYGLAFAAVGAVVWLAVTGWFPVFLVPGEGGTPARQFTMASSIALFALTALLLRSDGDPRSGFAFWYGLALLALAAGLFGIMVQQVPGSPVGWAGRVGQYLAGVYMLIAALAAMKEAGESSAELGASLGDSLGHSPSRTRPRYPYVAAFVLTISAAALRMVFLQALGGELSFLVFYPAVALAALYGGLRPGLLAAVLSLLLADWLWMMPPGSFTVASPADLLAMGVFFLGCVLIAWTAEAMHRAQTRALEAEAEARVAVERERAAQAVRASLDRLALGVDVSGIALADIDYERGAIRLSAEASRLFGLGEQAETFPRLAVHERFHPGDREELERRIVGALDPTGSGWLAMDHRVLRPDGQVRWVSVRKRVSFDRSGPVARPVSAMLAAQDVTERRHAEQALAEQADRLRAQAAQLREADRRKDELLAMLGHELRNPLTPILAAARLLEAKGTEDPALVQWAAGTLKHQGQTLVRLVDDLLDAARITQGKIALAKAPVDLGQLAERAIESCRAKIEDRQHSLSLVPCAEPPIIEADAVRLEQVLCNLLSNAAKYTPDGGRIEVSVARQEGWARVCVTDEGIGIGADMLPQVWGLFVQAEASRDRARGGLGIGLALVKGLVELHGGRVEIESAGLGLGTRATLWLPLRPEGVAPEQSPAPALPSVDNACDLLVVDDNEQVRASVSLLVRAMGHRARLAGDGLEALRLLADWTPHAILIDIGMPELDGYELARRIRLDPRLRSVKLIAMSGFGQPEDLERSARAGFDRHLIKPFDPRALAELLAAPSDAV